VKLSDVGLVFIAKEEGFVDHVYLDQIGVPTIGYGHALAEGEHFPRTITEAQGRVMLARDVAEAEGAVSRAVTVPLTQSMFDALVSLVFNLGPGQVMDARSSTLLRLLNAGDYAGASLQFAAWRMGGGKVLPVLVGRRAREAALFIRDGLVVHRDVNPDTAPDLRDPCLSEPDFGRDDKPNR
jgi:lysozyme